MRKATVVGGLVGLVAAACTGPVRTPEPQPVSAVAELARLRATGQLGPNRLECTLSASVQVVDDMRARLPALRRARNREQASAISAHARSVHANQQEAEVTAVVGARAAMERENATRLSAQGQDRAALAALESASRMFRQLRGNRLATSGDDVFVPLLSDSEADLLAEYTRLRATYAATPVSVDPGASARLREIEREQYGIQEIYAALFLQVYQDPELRCPTFG